MSLFRFYWGLFMRESFSLRTKKRQQPAANSYMYYWRPIHGCSPILCFLLLCGGFLQRMGQTLCSTKSCRNIASFSFKFTNNNPTCIETLDFVVVWWQTTRGRITGILWQQLLSINSGWFQQTYFMIWKKNLVKLCFLYTVYILIQHLQITIFDTSFNYS